MFSSRLTKKERGAILKQLSEHESIAHHTAEDERDYDIAWHRLSRDHFLRLRQDLNHITNWCINDLLLPDAYGEDERRMTEYFSWYDSFEVREIKSRISEAKQSLEWLSDLIEDTEKERLKGAVSFADYKRSRK